MEALWQAPRFLNLAKLTHTIRSIAQTQTVRTVPIYVQRRRNGRDSKSKRMTRRVEKQKGSSLLADGKSRPHARVVLSYLRAG